MDQWTFAYVTFGCLVVMTLVGLRLFRRRPGQDGDASPGSRVLLGRLYGGTCALLYLIVIAEILAGLFVIRSDGYGITLAGRAWWTEYGFYNEMGFRDGSIHDVEGRVLLLLGDSVAAGHGIKDTQDRLAERLEAELGPPWQVPVFAKPGWNLGEEIEAVRTCPLEPERVLVAYTLTDIETAANQCGLERPEVSIDPPPKGLRTIIAHSHLFNWLYWHHLRSDFGNRYWDFLETAYANPKVWQAHHALLQELIEAIGAQGATAHFVLWPDLGHLEESAPLLAGVEELLADEGVPVLDLTKIFQGRAIRDMTVNGMDDHPNERSQAEAAKGILEWLPR